MQADRGWRPRVCAAALLIVTTVAFLPAFNADFVKWDDPDYITNNVLLRNASGLKEIWNPFATTLQQYYPLVFTSYWLEYQVWQGAARCYHATNVALHLVNTVLVLLLVRAIGASLWVAAGAAAVFALHPVQVESVVWVTERKNTLSALFYLVSFLLYLRHRRSGTWMPYAASLLAFVCALLSKTQTTTLPVLIAFTDWVLQRRDSLPRARFPAVMARVAPMMFVALVSIVVTTMVERRVAPPWVQLPGLAQRVSIAVNAPFFYTGTFLAPFWLAPLYPKPTVSPASPQWWIGALACGTVLLAGWRWRGRLETLPLWGVAQFFIGLVPALGLVAFTYQHYAYVADRFLYLSCIGAGMALAALAARFAGKQRWSVRYTVVVTAGVLGLGLCATLTYRASLHWQSNFSFWTHAIAHNANSYPPNINLGTHYGSLGQWSEAAQFFGKAHDLQPTDTYALTSYLQALAAARGPRAVIEACDAEVKAGRVNAYVAYFFRAQNHERLGHRREALADYTRVAELTRPGSSLRQQAQQRLDRLQAALGP